MGGKKRQFEANEQKGLLGVPMTASSCVILWTGGRLSYWSLKPPAGLVQVRTLSWGSLSLLWSKDYLLISDASEILMLKCPRAPLFCRMFKSSAVKKPLDVLTTKKPLLECCLSSEATSLYCYERGSTSMPCPKMLGPQFSNPFYGQWRRDSGSAQWEQDLSQTFPAGLRKKLDSFASPTFSLLGFMGQIIEKELCQISVTE